MNSRFKSYLEREFRMIEPSKEGMEYREEVYGNLQDKAQELRNSGIDNENTIFEMCIDSLGNFKDTLLNFEDRRMVLINKAKKAIPFALYGIAAMLFIVIGYLVISFATGAWSKTWLIFIASTFVAHFAVSIVILPKQIEKKWQYFMIFNAVVCIILLTLNVFLFLLMLTDLERTWLAFLIMPIVITFVITLVNFLFNSKLRFVTLSAFIMTSTSLIYVILGIVGAVSWGIGWLLPAAGIFTIMIMICVFAYMYGQKNKEVAKIKKDKINYHTAWSDDEDN